MKQSLSGLEHRVLANLRPLGRGARWLLAVSGGVDSMVMASVILKWRRALGNELTIGHVHHGSDSPWSPARDEAQAFVRDYARNAEVKFLTLRPRPRGLHSEADWRDLRARTFARWARKYGFQYVLLAHHEDDLLETRVLRLLRGVGPLGLKSMSLTSGLYVRPLLNVTRAEVEHYAMKRELSWMEDPSNRELAPLRNWLRHEWLPRLEARQAGSRAALARSLELLAHAPRTPEFGVYVGLRREALHRLTLTRQQAVVVEYLNARGIRGYGHSHVREILKRLQTRRKQFTFDLLGFRFRVTPDLVWASRV